jgi:hypothetical protein
MTELGPDCPCWTEAGLGGLQASGSDHSVSSHASGRSGGVGSGPWAGSSPPGRSGRSCCVSVWEDPCWIGCFLVRWGGPCRTVWC